MNKTWAILCSVAKYNNAEDNLSFVRNDNDCIKKGLTIGLLIPDQHIVPCGNDGLVNYSDFQDIITTYSEIITYSDKVIIYFSGHGGGTPFSLKFTDGYREFSDICTEIDRLQASSKILIIDACYSGNSEIPESITTNPSHNLLEYARAGCAVFASSNTGRTSTCHPNKDVSLYTYCFSNALRHAKIRNGKVSLIDVAKQAAFETDHIAKAHRIIMQHPIFKCHIPEGVLFQITQNETIEKSICSYCQKHFDVYRTEILHSTNEMRYTVFAIIKDDISDELIASYTNQIANKMKSLRKFKNAKQAMRFIGKSTAVVFVYWGKSEEDVVRRNWIYRSTWASPSSDRGNWYRLNKESKIVSDIWIQKISQYDLITELNKSNSVDNADLIRLTRYYADPILIAVHEVIRLFEEYDNGEIPEYAFVQACSEQFIIIQNSYWRMVSLPVPSIELQEWSDCYSCLIASIDDMRIIYTSQTFLDRDEQNRKICMREAVNKYREDLQRLICIEEDLKKSSIIPSGVL